MSLGCMDRGDIFLITCRKIWQVLCIVLPKSVRTQRKLNEKYCLGLQSDCTIVYAQKVGIRYSRAGQELCFCHIEFQVMAVSKKQLKLELKTVLRWGDKPVSHQHRDRWWLNLSWQVLDL